MLNFKIVATFLFLVTTLLLPPAYSDDRHESARAAANSGDFEKARKIWEEMSSGGSIEATYNLGLLYARGDGVKQDLFKAREYFQQAADKNHTEAAARLGAMFIYGDGGKSSLSKAIFYTRKAAASGSQYAQQTADKFGISR